MKKAALLAGMVLLAHPAAARCWKPGQNVSWYGEPQRLPDGSRYNPRTETCASREYPAGTVLRVVDLDTGLGVECAINDFGPAPWTRCRVDLSGRSADRIGMKGRGTIRAKINVVSAVWPEPRRAFLGAVEKKKGPGIAAGAF